MAVFTGEWEWVPRHRKCLESLVALQLSAFTFPVQAEQQKQVG